MFRTYISETVNYHTIYYTVDISKYSPINLDSRKDEREMLNYQNSRQKGDGRLL